MSPLLIESVLQGGKSLYELGTGISQNNKANKLAENAVRPQYTIPQGEQDYMNNAKSMAGQNTYAGQQRDENNVFAGTSQALNSAAQGSASSADFLSTVAGINGNEQNAMGNIAQRGLAYQDQNKQHLNEALMSLAPYQDKQFQMNKYQPFIDQTNAARALKGAAQNNISNAFGNAAKTVSMVGDLGGNGSGYDPNYVPSNPNSPLNPGYTPPQGLPGGGPLNPNYKPADMMSIFQ